MCALYRSIDYLKCLICMAKLRKAGRKSWHYGSKSIITGIFPFVACFLMASCGMAIYCRPTSYSTFRIFHAVSFRRDKSASVKGGALQPDLVFVPPVYQRTKVQKPVSITVQRTDLRTVCKIGIIAEISKKPMDVHPSAEYCSIDSRIHKELPVFFKRFAFSS